MANEQLIQRAIMTAADCGRLCELIRRGEVQVTDVDRLRQRATELVCAVTELHNRLHGHPQPQNG